MNRDDSRPSRAAPSPGRRSGDSPLFSKREWAQITSALRFSPGQSRIVALLMQSLSDKQIARCRNITVPTLRTHFGRIYARVGVCDRGELVLRVFQEFLAGCRDCPRHRSR